MEKKNCLREWRLTKGVTLKQLAQKTGYRYSYLVHLEKGLRKGTSNTWISLARELQIPVKDLFQVKISLARAISQKDRLYERNQIY